jgi:uncharacterized protein YukJ
MKPRSAKAKGRRFVKEVVDLLVDRLLLDPADMRVVPSGVNGEDIWLSPRAMKRFPFATEVKNVEQLNIWSAIKQSQAHAIGTNRYPLVIFRRNHHPAYVCLELTDFIAVMKEQFFTGKFKQNKEVEQAIVQAAQEIDD